MPSVPVTGSEDAELALAAARVYRAIGKLWTGYSFEDLLPRAWGERWWAGWDRRSLTNHALRALKARDQVGYDKCCNQWFSVRSRAMNQRITDQETAELVKRAERVLRLGDERTFGVLRNQHWFREWLFRAVSEIVGRYLNIEEIVRLIAILKGKEVSRRGW
jgi:hypothetical protein